MQKKCDTSFPSGLLVIHCIMPYKIQLNAEEEKYSKGDMLVYNLSSALKYE